MVKNKRPYATKHPITKRPMLQNAQNPKNVQIPKNGKNFKILGVKRCVYYFRVRIG